MTGGPQVSAEAVAHAEWMLTAARDELVRADEKASILLAALGVAIGALIAGIIAGDWDPLRLSPSAAALWWAGAALIGAAVWLLTTVIYPSARKRRSRPLLAYFEDVRGLDGAQLRDQLEASARRRDEAVVDQLVQVSLIASVSYAAIRRALLCLPVGGVLCVAAGVLDAHVLR